MASYKVPKLDSISISLLFEKHSWQVFINNKYRKTKSYSLVNVLDIYLSLDSSVNG